MKSKLILFDIDKTLIKDMNLSVNPWKLAFERVYNINDSVGLDKIDTHGKTHKGLAIEALRDHGLSDKVINEKIENFLEELGEIYYKVLQESEMTIFDNTKELLKVLDDNDFSLGLITGNTKKIAFHKLKKVGIDHFFKIGGFGEDGVSRADLFDFALKRSKDEFKEDFRKENIFVIGDTPLDISSAKKHELKTVAVATGVYSKSELEKEYPDYCLDNLNDIEEILRIVSK